MKAIDAGIELSFEGVKKIKEAVFRHRLLNWYDKQPRDLPWRRDWEKYHDPYRIWLSEVMLQQTLIQVVIPAYKHFLHEIPSLKDFALAEEQKVRELVRGLGYYRRFSLMHRAAKQILELRKNGDFLWPASRKDWELLPGVGSYTSAAISSIAFGEAYAVIDGNLERVLCRLLDIRLPVNLPKLKPYYQKAANHLLDHSRAGDFNQAMMQLGQLVCLPKTAHCSRCPIAEFCQSFTRGSQALSPGPKVKRVHTDVELALVISRLGKKIQISERSKNAKFLRGTLGFSTYTRSENGSWILDGGLETLDETHLVTLGQFRHHITHHRLKVRVFERSLKQFVTNEGLDQKDVERNLISNLDRKAWDLLRLAKKIPLP